LQPRRAGSEKLVMPEADPPLAENLPFRFRFLASAGGRGVRGKLRAPRPLMKSVRIFSNTQHQLEKEIFAYRFF